MTPPPTDWSALERRLGLVGASNVAGAPATRVWRVPRAEITERLEALASESEWAPWQLLDVSAVDRSDRLGRGGDGLVLVYWLRSASGGVELRIEVPLDGAASAPSVTGRWPVARWLEREVRDLFGIEFDGAPDRRPLLVAAGLEQPPLRPRFAQPGDDG